MEEEFEYPRHEGRSMSGARLPYFTVMGGPFARPQSFGWHITDAKGFTVAVACDHTFVHRVNMLNELAVILKQADVSYHLQERRDQGYLDGLDEQAWERLRELLKEL
jgi:hypothetical protein